MAEPYLDHPGEIHWFKGQCPVGIAGPCPHGVVAQDSACIARGPSMERYTLDRNIACGCRAWFDARGRRTTPWLQPVEVAHA